MDENIVLKDKERSLYFGMVPKKVKGLFLQLAEDEFSSHYGFCLQWLINQTLEYQKVKEILLDKEILSYIIESKSHVETEEMQDKVKRINTLSGKELKGGEKK